MLKEHAIQKTTFGDILACTRFLIFFQNDIKKSVCTSFLAPKIAILEDLFFLLYGGKARKNR